MGAAEPITRSLNSDEVDSIINELSKVKGKKLEAMLEGHLIQTNLLTYIRAALDPFITYGIQKVPKIKGGEGGRQFAGPTFDLLKKLAERALTGKAAIEAIKNELKELTPASRSLLTKILTKDLKAGFSAKLVNKIIPDSIYVFNCMLAHKFEEKRIKSWPVAGDLKLDGVRTIAIYQGGKVKLFSRTGKEFEGFPEINRQIKTLIESSPTLPSRGDHKADLVMEGELQAGSGQFRDIQGEVHRKADADTSATFSAFDLLTKNEFDEGTTRPFFRRRAALEHLVKNGSQPNILLTDIWKLHSVDEVMAKQTEILAAGGEGLIIKPLDGPYEPKRSYAWLKIKAEETVDLEVIDVLEGEEGTRLEGLLGKFVVNYKGKEVSVGSGLTDALRLPLEEAREEYVGRLIEVKYHEETPEDENGLRSLRHPRFVRFRDDKPIEDGVGV